MADDKTSPASRSITDGLFTRAAHNLLDRITPQASGTTPVASASNFALDGRFALHALKVMTAEAAVEQIRRGIFR